MTTVIGMAIKYYPSIRDSRYFLVKIAEGDSFDGVLTHIGIDGAANITIDAAPGMKINFNRIRVLDALPAVPGPYGFCVAS